MDEVYFDDPNEPITQDELKEWIIGCDKELEKNMEKIYSYIKEMRDNDLGYNEEQREKMKDTHVNDGHILDSRIERLMNKVESQQYTISDLQDTINNMKHDLDRLKEGY